MAKLDESGVQKSSAASDPKFAAEMAEADADSLAAILADSRLDETHLCNLLQRKDLPDTFLQEIAKRRDLLRSYQVKRSLAFHPHVPRLAALRLIRELYLMDLVKLSQSPHAPGDLQHLAEEQLIARLSRVPLGERIALARQSSARVLGALLSDGHPRVTAPALNNPRLTEAQVLKVLSKEKLASGTLLAISKHARWSVLPNVRLALLRHLHSPLEMAGKLLSQVNPADLQALSKIRVLSAGIRRHIEHEISRRMGVARENLTEDSPQE